jgi:hypothetical protein
MTSVEEMVKDFDDLIDKYQELNLFKDLNNFKEIKGLEPIEQVDKMPKACQPEKVGTYQFITKAGGGFRYDRVLEYRVWFKNVGDKCPRAHGFATYREAATFALAYLGIHKQGEDGDDGDKKDSGEENKKCSVLYIHIMALVEQDYYYDYKSFLEPDVRGKKVNKKRIIEWQPQRVLENNK